MSTLDTTLHQRVDQVGALGLHRHREHRPRFRVLEEQVGVEVQRHLVAVHRDAGEAALEPGDVHEPLLAVQHVVANGLSHRAHRGDVTFGDAVLAARASAR